MYKNTISRVKRKIHIKATDWKLMIFCCWKTRHNPISIKYSECKPPGVYILQQDDGDVEKDKEEEDTMDAGLGGYQYMV